MSRIIWFCKLYAHQVIVCTQNLNPRCLAFGMQTWRRIIRIKLVKLRFKLLRLFIIELTSILDCSFKSTFSHLSMADNVIAFRCLSSIYPHLLLSPSHFQNSLSTFSIERINGIPLWDFYSSNFQRKLFILMKISPG